MKILAVIPARYESSRFPGKPLVDLHGKPMIQHVYERVQQVPSVGQVLVATDDERIIDAVQAFGGQACMTSPDHPTGTDRIVEVIQNQPCEWVLNVQGDEPVIHAEHLQKLCALMDDGKDMATLATPFTREDHFRDSNKVKVVIGAQDQALYFSRAPIPFNRDTGGSLPSHTYWHLGVYAYTAALLDAFTSWKPGTLEVIERLEQLRVLENGGRIGVGITQTRTVGIDVEEDLAELEAHLSELESQ